MNIPYRVPLQIGSDSAAYELGVSHPQAVTMDMTTGVYAQIGDHYQGNYEVTPTENEQALTTNALIMDDDVAIHAIPSDYVGSAIPRKDSLNVSGATVTADSGYYENGASATIPNAQLWVSTEGEFITVDGNNFCRFRGYVDVDESLGDVAGYVPDHTHQDADWLTFTAIEGQTITPTTSVQTIGHRSDVLAGTVEVDAIPSDYVGSDIPLRDSGDLTASGATVTAPAGYYAENASKSVDTMQLPATVSPTYSGTKKADITYSVGSGYKYLVIDKGYNTARQYYKLAQVPTAGFKGVLTPTFIRHEISVDANGEISSDVEVGGYDSPIYQDGWGTTTDEVYMYNQGGVSYQLPTQSATTVTPNDTQQTIVLAGKFTTGDIKVDPIPRTVNDFLGRDAEFVGNIHSHDYVLSSTGYNSWTPSTTAASIVAAQSLTAFAGDLANYEYCVRWLFDADIKYNTGTTQKAIILREVEEVWQVIAKRPSSLANISANNFNGNNCSTYFTAALMDYYNSSGTRTFTWSASYGLYLSMTAAAFSNSTSDTPNITIKTPAIYARCSNTYFSTARAADVDKANSKMAIKGELYRVKKDSSPSRIMYGHAVDLYNDSIIS